MSVSGLGQFDNPGSQENKLDIDRDIIEMCRCIAGNDVFQQENRVWHWGHTIDNGPDKIRNDYACDSVFEEICPTVIMGFGKVTRKKQEQSNREIDEWTTRHLIHAIGACVNQNNCYDSNCPQYLYVKSLCFRHFAFFEKLTARYMFR